VNIEIDQDAFQEHAGNDKKDNREYPVCVPVFFFYEKHHGQEKRLDKTDDMYGII
jgi:hypothetical protein